MEFNTDKSKSNATSTSALDKQLGKESNKNYTDKTEKIIFFWIKIVASVIIFALALAIVVAFGLHFILPPEKRWLSDIDLEHIRTFAVAVCSGVVASMVSNYYINRR